MATKHIFVVHGRSTKPVEEEKKRLVQTSLIAGLERVDSSAAQRVNEGKIKFTLIYYGDKTNCLMIKAQPQLKERMVRVDGAWYEPEGSYDEHLANLIQRPTNKHSVEDYRTLLANKGSSVCG